MSVSTTSSRSPTYTLDGVATVFATIFQFLNHAHVRVTTGPTTGLETVLTEGIDYTVSLGPPLPNSGSITLINPAINIAGRKLIMQRVTPLVQDVVLSRSGPTDPANIMLALDHRCLVEQELNDLSAQASSFTHGNLGGGALHALVVRGDHTVPGSGTAGFIGGDNYDLILDHVEIVSGDPHGAVVAHLAAGGSAHPLATALVAGFMGTADKAKLDGIPASSDPRTVFFDDFDGPQLWADKWARSTTGTAPVASVQTDEYGVYRELTAAANPSAVLLRSTAKGPAPKRGIVWRARLALGRQGSVNALCTARWGMSADPTLAEAADANFGYFFWDGATLNIECGSGVAPNRQKNGIGGLDTAFHDYEIDFSTLSVSFLIDGAAVATLSTKPPTSTTPMERFFEVVNTSNVQRSLDIDYCEILIGSRVYT